MYKILFSHSYFLHFDAKQWAIGQPYPPLGTLYAAAVMREKGFEVDLFDSMFANGPDEVSAALRKHRPDFFVIYDDGFNYLTKMCLTNMRQAAFRMIEIAKQHGCVVIVSGSDSTDGFAPGAGVPQDRPHVRVCRRALAESCFASRAMCRRARGRNIRCAILVQRS